MASKKPKTFPIPEIDPRICRNEIAKVISVAANLTEEQIAQEPMGSLLFTHHTFAAGGKFAVCTLVPTAFLHFLLWKINTKNKKNVVNKLQCTPTQLLTYIYELYKREILLRNTGLDESSYQIKQSSQMHNALLINGIPEYILNDLQHRSTKQNRPWMILAALKNMNEMPEWWYQYVDKWALPWVYAPPADMKDFHKALIELYGNMSEVKIL